jgi:hypothetical protein
MAVTCVVLVVHLLVACSSSGSGDDADVGGAYAAVVRWFVDQSAKGADTPVVFVDTQGEGFEIELGLQATIVSATEEFAHVRFIDDRSEAFGERGETVRDEGILLAVAPAVIDGRRVSIDCDQIIAPDRVTSWTFELQRDSEQRWSLVVAPTTIDS